MNDGKKQYWDDLNDQEKKYYRQNTKQEEIKMSSNSK